MTQHQEAKSMINQTPMLSLTLLTWTEDEHTLSAFLAHCFRSSSGSSAHLIATAALRSLKSATSTSHDICVFFLTSAGALTSADFWVVFYTEGEEEVVSIDPSCLLHRRGTQQLGLWVTLNLVHKLTVV